MADNKSTSYFNKAQNICVSEAIKALNGLTEDDITNFVKGARDLSVTKKLNMEDAVKEQIELTKKDFKNRSNLLAQRYNLLFNPKTGWYNQITGKKLHINDILANDTGKSNGVNVENFQKSSSVNLRRQWFEVLSKEDQNLLLAKQRDIDLYKALDGVKTSDSSINNIVSSLTKLKSSAEAQLIDSGAMRVEDMRKDFKFGINYDPMRVAQRPSIVQKGQQIWNKVNKGQKILTKSFEQAKQEFVDTMKSEANRLAMFGKDYEDDDIMDEAFGNMYDSIQRGASINKDLGINIRSEADLMKKQTQFFVPKNWQSYGRVLAKYGKNTSLVEQVFHYIHQTGSQVGLSRVLGDDPYWSFNQLLDAEHKTYGSEPTLARPTHLMAELTGYTSQPVNPRMAAIGANFRAYTTIARLPLIAATTLNDTNMGLQAMSAFTRNSHWQNFLLKAKGIADTVKGQVKGKYPEYINRIMGNLSHSLKYELGAMSRYAEATNMGQITRKVSNAFFHWNGMSAKDYGNIAGACYGYCKDLGDSRGLKFEDLPDKHQNYLKAFDISPAEWDQVRYYTDKSDYDEKLVTPDVLDNMSDDDAEGLATEIGRQRMATVDMSGMDPDQIDYLQSRHTPGIVQAKAELSAKLYSMLETAAHETVPYPAALERAAMNRGTKPGTLEGELLRSLMQFKGFLLSYINRILINGYKQDTSKYKLNWALTNFIYAVPLTAASNVLYNLSTGKDLNADPLNWDASDWVNTLTPALGIFTKSMNPADENHGLLMSTLFQSPTISDLSDLMGLGGATVNAAFPDPSGKSTYSSRTRNLGKKAAQTVSDFTPINSLPFASKWFRDNFISTGGRS